MIINEIVSTHPGLREALNEIGSTSQVYVDMDGVLADFFGEWQKLIGSNWRNVKKIEPALQKIRDKDDFWLTLPLLPQAKNLLNIIKNVKGSYSILSSPLPNDPNSEPHKREWIEKNLSFFPPENVIITHDKAKYATQQDGTPNILIDDFGQNISKWEAAGGEGFKHKDHKFERTAKAIKQYMTTPAKEQ
jgi:5'(3')-deoxyribonucleotidase